MPSEDEIKIRTKLRLAAIVAKKSLTEKQLDESVEELKAKRFVKKADLNEIGQKVAGDREIFASTDVDDINNLLGRLGEK